VKFRSILNKPHFILIFSTETRKIIIDSLPETALNYRWGQKCIFHVFLGRKKTHVRKAIFNYQLTFSYPNQTLKGPLSKYNPFKLLSRHLCFALKYLEVIKMHPVTISYRSLLNNS